MLFFQDIVLFDFVSQHTLRQPQFFGRMTLATMCFLESIDYVRDSGTLVEVGNFVDSGTTPFNPCTHLLEKGITIVGSFDNDAEHFVRSLPLVADERIPLKKLITHRLPLSAVQTCFEAIHKGEPLDGKEIVKIAIDPSLPEL